MPATTIRLTTQQLADYCAAARRSARNTAQALATLTTIETFVASLTDPGQKATPAYQESLVELQRHIEACRAALLAENAVALTQALHQQSPEMIAAIHASLSRSGFQQAMERAAEPLPQDSLEAAWQWAKCWCSDAEQRAAEASGYPDAFDFAAAGIRLETHIAMKDLLLFLNRFI